MTIEDWTTVGRILTELQSHGLYPGIGYDDSGWEAWVFFEQPIEGDITNGPRLKTHATTATAALESLIAKVACL